MGDNEISKITDTQIDEQTKSQLAAKDQLKSADSLECTILCNIIINSNEIRKYFFEKITEKDFFYKPFYYDLFIVLQNEIVHGKPISFALLETNIKVTDKTSLLLLKQFSEQHADLILNITDFDWKAKADKILESHYLLLLKGQLMQQCSKQYESISNISDLKAFSKIADSLGKLAENCRIKNLNFDEAQVDVSNKEKANEIISNIFVKDVYLPTGFYNYDKIHKGIPLGSLFMMAATSGAGKSMVALHLAMNVFSSGKRVCLVSLEMTEEEIMKRMLCIVSNYNDGENVTTTDFLKDPIKPEFIERLKTNYNKWIDQILQLYPEAKLDLRCRDNDMTLDCMLSALKNYKYDLIIIDYVGLLTHHGKSDQWQELSKDARDAKIFAQENNNVVCLLAQRERDTDVSFSRSLIHHSNVFWVFEKIREGEKDSILCKRDVNDPNGATYFTTFKILKNRNSSQRPFVLKLDYAHMSIDGGSDSIDDQSWGTPDILRGNQVEVKPRKVEQAPAGTSEWD